MGRDPRDAVLECLLQLALPVLPLAHGAILCLLHIENRHGIGRPRDLVNQFLKTVFRSARLGRGDGRRQGSRQPQPDPDCLKETAIEMLFRLHGRILRWNVCELTQVRIRRHYSCGLSTAIPLQPKKDRVPKVRVDHRRTTPVLSTKRLFSDPMLAFESYGARHLPPAGLVPNGTRLTGS